MPEYTQVNVRDFPADLWRQVKIRVLEEKTTIRNYLARALEHELAKGKPRGGQS